MSNAYTFQVVPAPDDPAPYQQGYPQIVEFGRNEQEAREQAAMQLDEGERLGARIEED